MHPHDAPAASRLEEDRSAPAERRSRPIVLAVPYALWLFALGTPGALLAR